MSEDYTNTTQGERDFAELMREINEQPDESEDYDFLNGDEY